MKLKKITFNIFLLTVLVFVFFTSNSYAQPAGSTGGIGTLTPPESIISNTSDIGTKFFSNVIRLIIALAGIWAFFQFILGGFAYITGAGDAKKVSEAQQKFIHAIIGLFIIAISFLLAGVIGLIFFDDPYFILKPTIQTL